MHNIYILSSSAAFSAIYLTTISIIVECSLAIVYFFLQSWRVITVLTAINRAVRLIRQLQ